MDTHTHYDTVAHDYGVETYTIDAQYNLREQRDTKLEAQVVNVDFGSGWYHESAIADRSPARKYEA